MAKSYRDFLLTATLFTALAVVAGVLQSILGLVRPDIISVNYFPAWVLLTTALHVFTSLFLLIYLFQRGYLVAFITAFFSAAVGLLYMMATYRTLVAREMTTLILPTLILLAVTQLFFSLSLIFSKASERKWLRTVGIVNAVVAVVFGYFLWRLTTADSVNYMYFHRAILWLSLVINFIPVFLILNYRLERKTFTESDPVIRSAELAGKLLPVAVLCGSLTLALGLMISNQVMQKVEWDRQLAIKAKEWRQLFESRTYRNANGDTLAYQLLPPLSFDSTRKYPLVVCLPYNRGVEGAPPAQWLLSEANRKAYPSFLYVPFCPEGSGWGGVPNYPTLEEIVFESIGALTEAFAGIDPDRVYVTGVSRGGYGSWNFISKRPDIFAAAVPVCGLGDPALAASTTTVAVWAFHGEKDLNVPVSGSRDMIAAMKDAGANPKYTEFSGMGHDIWNDVTATPGLLDWLFAQARH